MSHRASNWCALRGVCGRRTAHRHGAEQPVPWELPGSSAPAVNKLGSGDGVTRSAFEMLRGCSQQAPLTCFLLRNRKFVFGRWFLKAFEAVLKLVLKQQTLAGLESAKGERASVRLHVRHVAESRL